ncbi:hypothetical protein [Nonomuraea wenchangensis]|uniref:Uncharacterized protein n=1 Tax=Nonomuraea wenchangensis TaxID=568860 RepID=A0A1I0LVU3_9ACTN|nr:hypothetical protein [Nonomuraea wenchangensis]SEU47820.1 hypothetical protein SAMN05421811_13212 [Nonomuraea wenchangensis]
MEKDAIAYICEHSDDLRVILADPTPLDTVLDAVRDGDDPAGARPLLDALHAAVQRAGDAFGIIPHDHRGPEMATGAGLGSARRLEIFFYCPRGRCSRIWEPDRENLTVPSCVVFGEELAERRS